MAAEEIIHSKNENIPHKYAENINWLKTPRFTECG
jgi:hypothetical protein